MGKIYLILGLSLLIAASHAHANIFDLDEQAMKDVTKIARAIAVVNRKLDEPKYLEYATGIYRASLRYSIEPSVLIAITQQESSFREHLPEGAAGERGLCQILKTWLQNPKFKAEFRTATLRDFSKPALAFQFAAWILADLKARISTGSLPYWSFYNATKFHNRFKYFLAVNRYVAKLKKNEHLFDDKAIAALMPKRPIREVAVAASPVPVPEPSADNILAASAIMISSILPQPLAEVAARAPKPVPPKTVEVKPVIKAEVKKSEPVKAIVVRAPTGSWIPDAIKRMHFKNKGKQADARRISPALLRAAQELDVDGSVFRQQPIQD